MALGVAAGISSIGIILAGVLAEQRLWQQLQIQAKSEIEVLTENYRETTDTTPTFVINIPNQETLQNLALEANSAALIVNSNSVITGVANSKFVKTSPGVNFDPSGLVSKAMAKGWKITSPELPTELGLTSGLAVYTITPIKDQNQKTLGAKVLIKFVDTRMSMQDIGIGIFAGFTEIATVDDLKKSGISPNFPINIAQKSLTNTLVDEFKIEGKPYLITASPIINSQGQAIATFVSGNRYQSAHIALQVMALGLLFVIIGYIFGLSVVRAIAKSIQNSKLAAQDYANGNLLAQVPVSSQDEIGVLGRLFNGMIEKVHKSETAQAGARALAQAQNLELEDEVGQLLDVVSDLESGNLTVQAQVTDQATGLVADTLNRLIEQLATIISTVLSTAQQVTQGADSLEQMATSVTQNTKLQSQSVFQATNGIENINQLAVNASEEAIAANVAVKSAQTAVFVGQEEITKLNNSIALLQQGTSQIVQRLQTLGEYVDLAKQFVQDQKRLSSLTQVVAMNASMIAARAVEQKEPDQFASVAREFEAIASQVNNLATQTSQGLVVLQQRTGFIEIVVSGISQDIKDVTNYVDQFTLGVEQSSQAFNDIKDVTAQVAALGQTVFRSSQEIAIAVQSSVDSIQEIAALAQRSATQSNLTLERSAEMGQLARRLLSDVGFFQLPMDKVPQIFMRVGTNGSLKKADN
jgi:methyl-accepting chemotaxis protein PixJ